MSVGYSHVPNCYHNQLVEQLVQSIEYPVGFLMRVCQTRVFDREFCLEGVDDEM